ncbi:Uncharacterised protein [Mycobacteroides abscessus subsp. abscessus]|nr:hypothetical protein BAB78_01155 [Mycobacteroides abscessus]SHS87666.1 Uncharacterised protein [Mycobacteroides abscessus subsp. abscessus]OTR08812.1 hypothetical protein B9M85_01105 [Mycobacteroides abscessus]CPR89948.1 Uncharacterised protein [Mycobacteroides abscessus]SIC72579.1 Uncharacterised protein [Mycobacteroides abscessus subsp. abscessus]
MSTTANTRYGRFTAALTLAVTAAACGTAAPAGATPTPGSICDPNTTTNPSYDAAFCATWTDKPSGSSSSGGLEQLLEHPLVITVLVIAGVLLVGWILANIFGTGDEEQRGREIAEAHQQRVQPAVPIQDPAGFDPLGLGLAAPTTPAALNPAPIPEPRLTDADARRYARYGYAVDYEPGSAFASLTARDGGWKQAEAAWTAACQAAALGGTEMRKRLPGMSRIPGVDSHREVYVAPADLVRVIPQENGDAAVVVKPRSVAIGAEELNRVVPMFLRTARLRHAGRFVREHTTDEYLLTVSNRDLAAESAALPAPAATTDDDDWS